MLADIEANDWELYDLTTDYAETNNVAAEHRDKVIEMVGRWWAEAGKYNVMPIDGSMLERLSVERPTIAEPRDTFVYYPGGSPVPFSAAPKVYNRPFSITADVQIPDGGAEGVLVAHGGRVGGYTFFVKDSRLHFVYNFLGRDFFTVASNTDVPVGDVSLRYEFEPTGEPDFAAGKGVPGQRPALHRREAGRSRRHAAHRPEHLQHRGPHLRSRRRQPGRTRRTTRTTSPSPAPSSG